MTVGESTQRVSGRSKGTDPLFLFQTLDTVYRGDKRKREDSDDE